MKRLLLAVISTGLITGCSGDQEDVQEVVSQESTQEEVAQEESVDEDISADEISELMDADEAEFEDTAEASIDSEPVVEEVDTVTPPADLGKYWVFVGEARVFNSPAAGAQVVKTISYGEKIMPVDKSNGFIKIAEGEFVRVKDLTNRSSGFASRKNVYWIQTGDVNVHSEPDANSAVVSKLTKGERVIAVGRKNGWVQINDGQFISPEHLSRKMAH